PLPPLTWTAHEHPHARPLASHDAATARQRAAAPVRALPVEGASPHPRLRHGSPESGGRGVRPARAIRRSRVRRGAQSMEAFVDRRPPARGPPGRGPLLPPAPPAPPSPRPPPPRPLRRGLRPPPQHDSVRARPRACRPRRGGLRRSGFRVVARALPPIL